MPADEGQCGDFKGFFGDAEDDELSVEGESIDGSGKGGGVGEGGEDDGCSAEFLEFLSGVLGGGVDVVVCAEGFGEWRFVLTACDGDGLEA